ncbi:DUF6491 family protein [Aliikangiella maris]|uniref:DUF6491 family protein n=2 Tax=Aliikangiella maris TaxID=3162458 RepID=A0ABV2BW34_9GAMM
MNSSFFSGILLVIFLVLGSGCTAINKNKQTIDYQPFIDEQKLEKISRITLFRLHGWRALNENYLILDTSPHRPYLIELKFPCVELKFSHAIAVHHSSPGSLESKFDAIYIPEYPHQKCYIESIYRLSKEQAQALFAFGKDDSNSHKAPQIEKTSQNQR